MAKYPKMKKISWKTFQILICLYTHSIRVKSTHLLAPPTCCITEDKIRIKISFTTFYLFIILQLFYLFALIYFYYFVAFFLQTSVCLKCENFGPRKSMWEGRFLFDGRSKRRQLTMFAWLFDRHGLRIWSTSSQSYLSFTNLT